MYKKNLRLLFILLALSVALVLAACAPSAPAAPTSAPPAAATAAPAGATSAPAAATSAPAAAGTKTLRMARNAEPFSPFIPWQIDDNPCLFISVNVYDTLLRTTKDGFSVEPGLATKWDSSTDGLTWTFTLRDGVKFSDGTPLKANDVKVSLDMVRAGEKSAWKDSYKAIKEVQAPDDKTVKIILSQAHAPLLSELAMFSAAILPAD